jgi:hypothetical protein
MYNGNRFSFAQMTSNGDGKTSGSGAMGVLIVVIGCLTFLLGALDRIFFSHSIDIMTQTIVFTGIGAGLLGLKKWKATGKDSSFSSEVDEVVIPPYMHHPPGGYYGGGYGSGYYGGGYPGADEGSYYQGGYPCGNDNYNGDDQYNLTINYKKSENNNTNDPI